MTREDANSAIVRRICEEWPVLTLADVQELLAPDCAYINIPWSHAPRIGPEAAFKLLNSFREWKIDLDVRAILASGDTVLTERLETFFKPGSSDGHELPVMGAFKLKDGKVIEWRDYFDSAHAAPLRA